MIDYACAPLPFIYQKIGGLYEEKNRNQPDSDPVGTRSF
jgi:hypothetical protein